MAKTFKIPGAQIREMVGGRGFCYASDRITVDGSRVGYTYREPADKAVAEDNFVEVIESAWRDTVFT
jgi:hypothetical protein